MSAFTRSRASSRIRGKYAQQSANMYEQKKAGHQNTATAWCERFTVNGTPYYHHTGTGKVAWEKPDALKTADELKIDKGSWIWLKDDVESWVAASHIATNPDGTYVVQTGAGRSVTVKKHPTEQPLWSLNKASLSHLPDDLVMLDNMNEAEIIYNLRERFKINKIYTWVGASKSVLVSVNPFKRLPLYTPEIMDGYAHPKPMKPMGPHVFAIANTAYNTLQLDGISQAILISGESGAGKTEATKQCLAFLADVAGSESDIEERILMANPVLEAYGNAKTLRNNNSSRFGKWIEIHFNNEGRTICGARIDNYLLEKSRLTYQQTDERNYHIFYQLCKSHVSSMYGLGAPALYHYLNQSGCVDVRGMDDVAEFKEVEKSLRELGFTDEEKDWMFRVTCGVLNVGNATFEANGEGSRQTNSQVVKVSAEYLDLDPKLLDKTLLNRSIVVRGERSVIPLKPDAARDAVDALAKDVYGRLFDWLVKRVNQAIDGEKGKIIGVLDIFGFEIFEINSFEQLCINFANEKLQQHFNKHTFKEEESVYISEGVPYTKVKFIDNQPVLNLIEKTPNGILVMLDEEIHVPKGSDIKFVHKIERLHKGKHASFQVDRIRSSQTDFTVVHYAGAVRYEAVGFCVKNKDKLFDDMVQMLKTSSDARTRSLYESKGKSTGRRGGGKQKSMGGKFRKQLNALMKQLEECGPQYIRCIKSNHEKRGGKFVNKMCLEQLRYSGVFEAVEIRKTGYPFRWFHAEFAARFRCITLNSGTHGLMSGLKAQVPNYQGICKEILGENFAGKHGVDEAQVGRARVLYRAKDHHVLELLRVLALDRIVPLCQRIARGAIHRRFFRVIRACTLSLNEAIRACKEGRAEINVLDEALNRTSTMLGPLHALFTFMPKQIEEAKELRRKLLEWVEVAALLRALERKDPQQNYMEFGAVTMRAEAIMDVPHTEETERLYTECKRRLDECAAARLSPEADEALYLLDLGRMKAVLEEASKVGYTNNDLGEIKHILSLPENEIVKLQLKKAIELKDPLRQTQREVQLKMMQLEQFESMFEFQKLRGLRDPIDYANAKYFGLSLKKDKIAAKMLQFTKRCIHISLTQMPTPKESKVAVKLFKYVLSYMGDKKSYSTKETLATDFLNAALDGDLNLRTELYVQIMKQLSANPNLESEKSGWDLLALLIATIPPPPVLENYLVVFLMKKGKKRGQPWISEMHRTQYERSLNGAGEVMSETAMKTFLSSFNVAPKRSRFSFVDSGALIDIRKSLNARKSSSSSNGGGNIPTSPISNDSVNRKQSSENLGGLRASSLVTSRGSLPPGWEKVLDPDSGKFYYLNRLKNLTQWENPNGEGGLPPGWESEVDESSGNTYYINTATGETQWDRP